LSYRSIFSPGLFSGKTYLVTGGGSGIGRCVATELASLGANLALLGRNREKLQDVATRLAETGTHVSVHPCDIRQPHAVDTAVNSIVARHGALDGLVNNAGGQFPALLQDITSNGWDAVVRNNLHGTFFVSQACYRAWFRDHGGAIVNVLADFWNGMPEMGHSGAARAGAMNFTETAATEWAHSGVRVNAVAPGWIDSSGLDTYSEEYRKKITSWSTLVPLSRLGTESEVSAGIVFLLSSAASFITGSVLRIDGGVPNVKPQWNVVAGRSTPAYCGNRHTP